MAKDHDNEAVLLNAASLSVLMESVAWRAGTKFGRYKGLIPN